VIEGIELSVGEGVDDGVPVKVTEGCEVWVGVKVLCTPPTVARAVGVTMAGGKVGTGPGA
jgi:hypothetical protein